MAGVINLFISKEGEVLKVSNSKFEKNIPIPKLCSQEVLHVQIVYETENRKPDSMIRIFFDRLSLNDAGQYIENMNNPALENYKHYALCTVEELSKREEPLVIPAAPILPTQLEKECMKEYLKNKYPALWANSPHMIEMTIKKLEDNHKIYIEMFKKASFMRKY